MLKNLRIGKSQEKKPKPGTPNVSATNVWPAASKYVHPIAEPVAILWTLKLKRKHDLRIGESVQVVDHRQNWLWKDHNTQQGKTLIRDVSPTSM
jgi:hypothetical protein